VNQFTAPRAGPSKGEVGRETPSICIPEERQFLLGAEDDAGAGGGSSGYLHRVDEVVDVDPAFLRIDLDVLAHD
jgi:hypothetical protein